MKKTLLITAILAAFSLSSGPALAHGGGSNSGNGNPSSNSAAAADANASALGLGIGVGYANSSNRNVNRNSQRQRQQQHQRQSQSSSNRNSNNSAAASQQALNIQYPDYPVSTAAAPALTSGFDTCLGSISAAGQGFPVGISFGTTKEENICVLIKLSKRAEHLNDLRLANALLCEDARWRAAKEAIGEKCPAVKEPEQVAGEGDQNMSIPDKSDRDLRPAWVRGE